MKLPQLPAPYSEKAALGGFPAAQYTRDQMIGYGEACAADTSMERAWLAVVAALNDVSPNWMCDNFGKSATECAVAAIRSLAASKGNT